MGDQDILLKEISGYLESDKLKSQFINEVSYNDFVNKYETALLKQSKVAVNNNLKAVSRAKTNVKTTSTYNNINDNSGRGGSTYTSVLSDTPADLSLNNYGLFNTPHMYSNLTDPHMSSNDWKGRAYSEHILSNSPVVVFRVGKPKYMDGKSSVTSSTLEAVLDVDEEKQADFLNNIFKDSKQNEMYYYTFNDNQSVFKDYCDYVDTMVRYTAVKMGLTGTEEKFGSFNLYNFVTNKTDSYFKTFFKNSLNINNAMAFYVDGQATGYSESGSNNTGDSQMASSVKTLGQTKREVDFLFGTTKNTTSDATASFDSYKNSISSAYSAISGGVDGLLNKLGGMFTSISTGANVLFPEIWQDSSYRSSYNIEIKLSSPYGDDESIFKNVYLPFFCLLGMAMPRQSGKQGYTGPFLVQCYSRGWFSCNLGMIESIDVKKAEWSFNDLPTEITVSLSIKDLYPTIVAVGKQSNVAFGHNIGMQEYLKTMAGIEITDFDPMSNIEEAVNILLNKVNPKNILAKSTSKTTTVVGSGAKKIIKGIFGGIN